MEYNSIGEKESKAVLKVMKNKVLSGFLASPDPSEFFGGPEVKKLENLWKKKFNTKYAVSVNSATSGLFASLSAINIKPGDEVIVPPFTMSATAIAPLAFGAIPVFVDIEDKTFGLDPKLVERAITKKTKAIIVVNLFGHAAELKKIREITDKYKIILIEDNAQSILASDREKYCGNYGHIGIFSLNRHKHIHCGEGGVCITNDNTLGKKLILIRNHGEGATELLKIKNDKNIIGYNFRLTELSAAIASAQFKKLDKLVNRCEKIGLELSNKLGDFDSFDVPIIRKNCRHVFFMWAIQYNIENNGVPRNEYFKVLKKQNVPIEIGYNEPLYKLPIFSGDKGNKINNNYTCRVYNKTCKVTEDLHLNRLMIIQIPGLDIKSKNIDEYAKAFKYADSYFKRFI
jgi:dTDP-4-amino-4,6-dideoxygalactose transaminase